MPRNALRAPRFSALRSIAISKCGASCTAWISRRTLRQLQKFASRPNLEMVIHRMRLVNHQELPLYCRSHTS
ncbi:unnamed protein product [Peniophora sp. CBMAI 1063]|nr:unnamed protein product [Peniophora sp. CBMAI 1063]